jgi:spore coat polysaccharide biosynthesis predicted glycosyltransferase SpsG
MSALIYADGSKSIGLGHLMRMRTLALGMPCQVRILTATSDLALKVFADTALTVTDVSGGDIETSIVAAAQGAALVILDPPFFPNQPDASSGPAWRRLVDKLRKAGAAVARFTDEEQPTAHYCDVVINGYPLAHEFSGAYFEAGARVVLAGPQYFLIDSSHAQASAIKGGIFVCFGGSDQNDLLLRFLPALKSLALDYPVEIVAGLTSSLVADMAGDALVHAYLRPIDFAGRLKGARMALTASGNVLFERVFHRTPGISVAQFERQDRYGQAFNTFGTTMHLGLGENISVAHMKDILSDFYLDREYQERQKQAANCIDMLAGYEEIQNILSNLATKGRVSDVG